MFSVPSDESTTNEFELSAVLARLGLSQYEERLRENGFEDWQTVTAIMETDMAELDFKLGDRRKLQRAIHEWSSTSASYKECESRCFSLSSGGQSAVGEHSEATPRSFQPAERTTRPYRRHPRPDPDAPQKPKTAYVLFGEHVRQDPTLSHARFTEIAKETGKRWSALSEEERVNTWVTPAADRLGKYKEELERYKKTENYKKYQTYLEEFKNQQRHPETSTLFDNKPLPTHELASPRRLHDSQEEPKAPIQESVNPDDLVWQAQPQDMALHADDRMDEVRHISKALGVNIHLRKFAAFPPEDITTKAVEAFIYGTGSLLYLWDRNEAFDLVRSVYHQQDNSKPIHATEVFAMSAVGSYCDAEAHTIPSQENFLHFFLSMLNSSSDMCDLHCMRLFACLAICRFTNSVESARRLMSLGMGRKALTSPSLKAQNSKERVSYWQNVFRSIVFLESWFAYNTNHESRVDKQDLSLYRSCVALERGTLQEHVGELGRLAAYIALDLKSAAQPKAKQASVHFESLSEWHRTLPPPMQLSRLSIADPYNMTWQTKRSLLQLHILFLGLFIEPYRDSLVDLAKFRFGDAPLDSENLNALYRLEEQCVSAARQSARVASLLQTNNLIRSHCWVSIYTSFTGCAILIFSASQKLLQLSREEASQELSYTASHLSALSFCSYNNTIARRLHSELQIIFNDIREVMVSPVYSAMCELGIVVKDRALLPISYYDAVEGAKEVTQTILGITRSSMGILQEPSIFRGQ